MESKINTFPYLQARLTIDSLLSEQNATRGKSLDEESDAKGDQR
jgi:hypothetical protein